jgi:hypothetical protein
VTELGHVRKVVKKFIHCKKREIVNLFLQCRNILLQVGVNPDLYYNVFGESLLNDGVAVVLYNMMIAFAGQFQQRVFGYSSTFIVILAEFMWC